MIEEQVNAIIYKYPLLGPTTVLALPTGSTVLCVATQAEKPTLWVLRPITHHEPLIETVDRTFIAQPTGWPLDVSDLTYLGTAHGVEGDLVLHIFERPPCPS